MSLRWGELPVVQTLSLPGRSLLEGWLTFSGDGRFLMVHSADGWLQVWDVERRALAYEYDQHFLLGVATSVDTGQVMAFARDRFVALNCEHDVWSTREYSHSLPTRDETDAYVTDLWVRSMVVGRDEIALATWRWVASVATADPSQSRGFHTFTAADINAEAICVRQSQQGTSVSLAYQTFRSLDLNNPEELDIRFVTLQQDGRVIGEVTLDGRMSQFCHRLHDSTATAILSLSAAQTAAVFHGPEGAFEIQQLDGVKGKPEFFATQSGTAVIGITPGNISRWTRTRRTPTTIALPGGRMVARPSHGGERCFMLSCDDRHPLRGVAVDLERGHVIGQCVGHAAGPTPYAFSPDGRLFASVVTGNTETDFPGLCKDGSVLISNLSQPSLF